MKKQNIFSALLVSSVALLIAVPALVHADPADFPPGGNVDANFNTVTGGTITSSDLSLLSGARAAGQFHGGDVGVVGFGPIVGTVGFATSGSSIGGYFSDSTSNNAVQLGTPAYAVQTSGDIETGGDIHASGAISNPGLNVGVPNYACFGIDCSTIGSEKGIVVDYYGFLSYNGGGDIGAPYPFTIVDPQGLRVRPAAGGVQIDIKPDGTITGGSTYGPKFTTGLQVGDSTGTLGIRNDITTGGGQKSFVKIDDGLWVGVQGLSIQGSIQNGWPGVDTLGNVSIVGVPDVVVNGNLNMNKSGSYITNSAGGSSPVTISDNDGLISVVNDYDTTYRYALAGSAFGTGTTTGAGVSGYSDAGRGVSALSGTGYGVYAQSGGTALYANSSGGTGADINATAAGVTGLKVTAGATTSTGISATAGSTGVSATVTSTGAKAGNFVNTVSGNNATIGTETSAVSATGSSDPAIYAVSNTTDSTEGAIVADNTAKYGKAIFATGGDDANAIEAIGYSASGINGIGNAIWAQSSGTGDAVHAIAPSAGRTIYAGSNTGIGIEADSGQALSTTGEAGYFHYDTATPQTSVILASKNNSIDANGVAHIASTAADTLRLEGPSGGALGYGGRINFGDANYAYIQENTDDHLYIYGNSGTSIMGGSVGIGTTAPSSKLDVAGQITGNSIGNFYDVYSGVASRSSGAWTGCNGGTTTGGATCILSVNCTAGDESIDTDTYSMVNGTTSTYTMFDYLSATGGGIYMTSAGTKPDSWQIRVRCFSPDG